MTNLETSKGGSDELLELAESIRADPENSNLRVRYGEALSREGNYAVAVKQLERAISLTPDKLEPRLLLGKVLLDQGRAEGAETCLATVITKWPNSTRAHLVMGYCLKGQGKIEDAKTEFQKVVWLTDDPTEKASAHLGLAAIYESLDNEERADRHYGYAIAIIPQLQDVLVKVEKERLWPRSMASGSLDPTRPVSAIDRRKQIEDLMENILQE